MAVLTFAVAVAGLGAQLAWTLVAFLGRWPNRWLFPALAGWSALVVGFLWSIL